jgi:pimeloyl-ACP methyl ester carboxylesterase
MPKAAAKRSAIVKTGRVLLLLALLLAVFLLYSLLKIREMPSVVLPPAPPVRDTPLYRHVEQLSVRIGSRSVFEYDRLAAAKDYILACIKGMGYSPAEQAVPYRGRDFHNIIVTLPGKDPRRGVVVIGAHYDTVAGTPGADDNASAVAVLLEMARLLKDAAPERTIELVFFTLEEPPVFRTASMGSAVYARAARERGENIVAMICLEMVGYYSDRKGGQSYPLPFMRFFFSDTPDFIAVVGNLSSRRLVRQVADSLRKSGGVPVETLATLPFLPGVDFSDHRSFWKEGYRAVMITDTAFYRNPNYHTERDTIDTLDFHRMSLLLPGLVQAAKDLAGG